MKKKSKENITIWCAVAMLAFGAAMTTAGFCVPPLGEVSGSVLTVLGQCLLFSGSALGIANYVRTSVRDEVDRYEEERMGK